MGLHLKTAKCCWTAIFAVMFHGVTPQLAAPADSTRSSPSQSCRCCHRTSCRRCEPAHALCFLVCAMPGFFGPVPHATDLVASPQGDYWLTALEALQSEGMNTKP